MAINLVVIGTLDLILYDHSPHEGIKNPLAIFQLTDSVFQEDSLALGGWRFSCNGFDFSIGHFTQYHRREDVFETTDYMTFADLGRNICDEDLRL